MNPMKTTKQKPIIVTQELERKEHKNITKENHQTTREETKRRTEKNYKNNQKTSNKMAISTYLLVITLNVNGLNAPIKRYRMDDWIKNKTYLYST